MQALRITTATQHVQRSSTGFRQLRPPHTVALRSADVERPQPRRGAPGALARLSGWGRATSSAATVASPRSADQVARELYRALEQPDRHRTISRGMGRSYGDAALSSGGTVLDLRGLDRILDFDTTTGVLVAEAGATLAQIVAQTHPRGWLPPVMPGTAHVSLGGAVASDVHGKNHVSAGTFGAHVLWIDLLQSDLSVTRLSPVDRADEFWATVGGMGLTGVILAVSMQLRRAGGSVLRHQRRVTSLTGILDVMEQTAVDQLDRPGLHAVAWLDASRPGAARVRGIVETAQMIGLGRRGPVPLPARTSGSSPGPGLSAPSLPGPGVITATTIRGLNALRWNSIGDSRTWVGSVRSALQPLDRVELWPAAFGREGLVQCQVAVPAGQVHVLARILGTLDEFAVPPALVTLKRFGAASLAPLSFPIPGWTMAMDFPARWPRLGPALDHVEGLVVVAGGRTYLTKDSRSGPANIVSMYPRLGEWQETRDAMDPGGVFGSDLGRRLHLVPARVTS